MLSHTRFVSSAVLCLLVVAGCSGHEETTSESNGGSGGTTDNTNTNTNTGGDGTGGAPQPAVLFFIDQQPQDTTNAEVETDEVRWADPNRIVVDGVHGAKQVRLDISTGSWGVFTPDAHGVVDLRRDAPASGTWMNADEDGPFWSAPPEKAPVFDVDVKATDAESGAVLAEKTVHRHPVNTGVEGTNVSEGMRVGTLVRPPVDGKKRPAVLAFGGSEGGASTGKFLSYYMAQLGYVSFGVGYFGAPGLPAQLEEVPLEILKDDLDYLASQPDVDPERIAVLGVSRGGELALLLGATYPDRVHAVAAMVPSGYVWGATTGSGKSAWSLGGVPVPCVPSAGGFGDTVQKGGKTYILETPAFLEDIDAATPDELAAARIPVEKIQGPVLMIAGDDDQLWPSCVLAQVAWDGLEANGHTGAHADEMHCYPDAGHFIAFPPGSSTMASDAYYEPDYDVWFLVGGTPEGIAHAQRRGNTALRAFLETAFPQ